MNGWRLALAVLLGALAAGPAVAQSRPSADYPPRPYGVIGTPGGSGPWPAVAEYRQDLPGHTLYRPANWPGVPLPVVLWGNGACRDNGLGYATFLRQVASWGYLVVAVGAARFEGRQPAAAAAPAPRAEADETRPEQLLLGLDWIQRVSADSGSPWAGRVDASRVAVLGHSCGGLQALAVSTDPRITTTILFNSGVYVRGNGRSGVRVGKEILARLHGAVAWFSGGVDDIAHPNAVDDIERVARVPAFLGALPVGHGGTFWTEPDGGEWAAVAVRWLDWQLHGDPAAASTFVGARCGLCVDPRWQVIRRRLD